MSCHHCQLSGYLGKSSHSRSVGKMIFIERNIGLTFDEISHQFGIKESFKCLLILSIALICFQFSFKVNAVTASLFTSKVLEQNTESKAISKDSDHAKPDSNDDQVRIFYLFFKTGVFT